MPYQTKGPLTALPPGHPCEDCLVRPISICRRLDAETLANLRAMGRMQRLKPGQPVFHEGDPVRRAFMLASGSLKIYTLLVDGRRQITGFMFPGDFLGISIDDEYAYTAQALDMSELWWFTRDEFDRFVEANPRIERELYRLAAHELAAAHAQLVLLGRKTASERVASFILSFVDRQELGAGGRERPFDLPMTRVDIADYLGLTKETVSRMLTELRTGGLIRMPGRDRIEILDRTRLEEMADGVSG